MIYTKNYVIQFNHVNNHHIYKKLFKMSWKDPKPSERSYTICKIYHNPDRSLFINEAPFVQDRAICAKEDIFDKKKGRLISFQRCMEKISNFTTKEQRQELWEGYKSMNPNKPF